MKKTFILVVTLLFVVGVTGMAMAGIAGSKHDFNAVSGSGSTWGVTTGEICKACHAPHTTAAQNRGFDDLLWNRTDSVSVYVPYDSSTLQLPGAAPDGHSKLCLSCHDGTVAINAFPGETTVPTSPKVTNSLQIAKGGTNLMGQHPVSVFYEADLHGGIFDDGLEPDLTIGMGAITLDEALPGGKVQCSSCHDVHNNTPNETVTGTKLLRVTMTASGLCLKCHLK